MNNLSIEQWSIEKIVPYANNPRQHDHAVANMAKVLSYYGFRIPLLVKSSGELIDGHLRLKAAQVLNLDLIPVIIADDLSEEQIKAFRLMINRSATWAEWDEAKLLEEIQALASIDFDLSLTAFDQREIDAFLIELGEKDNKKIDDIPVLPENPIVNDGDIWILGKHRLLCGDSTSEADLRRLMQDKLADMIWTDPPYNVDYKGVAGKIKNDKMNEQNFELFLHKVFKNIFAFTKAGGAIYVAHSEAGGGTVFRKNFISAGFKLSSCLIWRKKTATLSRSDYQWQHEPILYGWKPGAAHKWFGNRKQKSIFELYSEALCENIEDKTWQLFLDGKLYKISGENLQIEELASSIIDMPKPIKSELHPTMKPVALVEKMIANSSSQKAIVLDPFAGSGTTLMACEILGRTCYTAELDPKYAEVVIRRWEEYTGQIAYRLIDQKTLEDLAM